MWTETFQRYKMGLENCVRDPIVNICWIIKKAREFQENIYFFFIDYAKAFVWITTNRKILQEVGIPDHLTCLLRNLYAVQEVTVRTGHGTTDWFNIGKGMHQDCTFSSCLFNSMQSTSWGMLGWMKPRVESRLPGEISVTSEMQMTPPLWHKPKRNQKASWWRWNRRVQKLA